MNELGREFDRAWKASRIVQACKIESRIKAEEELLDAIKLGENDYHRGLRGGLEIALKLVKTGK